MAKKDAVLDEGDPFADPDAEAQLAAVREERAAAAQAEQDAIDADAERKAKTIAELGEEFDEVAIVAAAIAEGERGRVVLPNDPVAASFTGTAKIVLAALRASKVKP